MLDRLLPKGSRARGIIMALAGFIFVLLITRLMPSPSAGRSGTPSAVLFLGLVFGLLNALVTAGIILIYRTSRIINFAQASIGGAGGIFAYHLAVADTVNAPFLVAFLAGVIVAGLVGAGVEIAFVRRFFNAPRLVLTVLTIALIGALFFAIGFVQNLPIFGDPASRSIQELGGQEPMPLPFNDFEFSIGDLPLPFDFGHLFAIGISIVTLVGLAMFLRYSKAGVATRAASENADRAMLLGINVKGLSTIVWAITGVLSGVGVIMTGTLGSFTSIGFPQPEVFLSALAAAVIARMKNLPIATLTAVGLEIIRQAAIYNLREQAVLFNVFVFFVILIALLIQRKEIQRSEEGETSSWKASEEFRPIPKEMLEIGAVRMWRRVLIVVGIAAVGVFPWITSTGVTNQAGAFAIQGIAILSLVALTGWAGQVSLGHWGLVAVGAIIGGALTAKLGWSFWLAIPITAVFTGAFAVLIGLPALRIRGLYLAVTTSAFAFASLVLFDETFFGWLLPGAIDRPTLFLFDFDDERSMYYLSVFAFVLTAFIVTILRRSRPGRVLIALRENENNAQSFGVNLVRTKLSAFALSGFLCGVAGVLFAHHQRAISAQAFPAIDSLNLFIFAVIGGISSVSGAILGTIYFGVSRLLGGNPVLQLIIGPIGLLFVLYIAPGGLASIFFGFRDAILRIVAQRRRLVVPSLFADLDPNALELSLAPLSEPIPGTGLVNLPFDQRYRAESRLYRERGKLAITSRRSDIRAIDAAAEAFESIGAAAENVPAHATGEVGEIASEVAAGTSREA